MAQACRVAELAFMGLPFFLLRNVMSAISVAQARRVAELAFMGFLFFVLRNVMSAISVAQARRVAELAFIGFLFFLLRGWQRGGHDPASRANFNKIHASRTV